MKSISDEYKEQLKAIGRQYKAVITYTIDETDYTLENEDLNAVTPHYEGDILKSVMKQLDLDSNVDIPIGTEINCQFGLLVNNDYEMIDLGNYIVNSSEKQEELNSYKLICYDKMIYSMINYEDLDISYPISVKNYITAICNKLGLTLATDEFVNDSTLISNEKYLTSDGESLGYTFRDVLDELAQVTASTICINSDDELEIRYIDDNASSSNVSTRSANASSNEQALLPDGYTQVEYIKTPSDSQGPYIDTLFYPNAFTSLDFDFAIGNNGVGGIYGYKGNSYAYRDFSARISGGYMYLAFENNEIDWFPIERNVKHNFELVKSGNSNHVVIKTEDTTIKDYTYSGNASVSGVTFPILSIKKYETGAIQYPSQDIYIYEFKIYNGRNKTNLVRDLIPCLRDNDNKPGLYDIVNDVFYTNAGTGEFEYALPPTPPVEIPVINEENLNDTNVTMMKKFGPINSVVLSRTLDNDNIYRKDDESIEENGLTEIKISNNEILNGSDRDEFIDEIFDKLNGLEFYTNDYVSKGITYLDLCDKYKIEIGEDEYDCVMLNDELEISNGFSEIVHTDEPKTSQSDYAKASKSDREAQRTEFIIDKQNGIIESLVEKVVDISVDGATTTSELTLNNVADCEPFSIIVKPLSSNIESLYPSSSNYPSSTNYLKARAIRFYNNTTNEIVDYELPCDLLYYNENNYDTFELDYDNKICRVLKMCDYNNQGQVVPVTPYTLNLDYPEIQLTRGDYTISVLNYSENVYIYCKLLALNDFTSQMATDIQVSSQIKQTADQIMIQVNEKVNEDDIIASLNVAVEGGQGIVELKGNSVAIESDNFTLDKEGNVKANALEILGGNIILPDGYAKGVEVHAVSQAGFDYFSRLRAGGISFFRNDILCARLHDGSSTPGGVLQLFNEYGDEKLLMYSSYNDGGRIIVKNASSSGTIYLNGHSGNITCVSLTQTSLEKLKKNFEPLINAIDIVKNTDIYKYNLLDEKDKTKKHIGVVIGDKFKYCKDITSIDNDGIDLYAMVSTLWQAVKEQQEEIDNLKKQIKEMK